MEEDKTIQDVKILCVDDDPIVINFYEKYFENTGYKITIAGDGSQGFELARKIIPDIIISDVVMPGMSGFEFCEKVRKEPSLESVIFILVSASRTEVTDSIKGIDIGADDYLLKPVHRGEILAKVKAFMRLKSLQDKVVSSNRQLKKAYGYLQKYKAKLEEKNKVIQREKKMLQNSMKQISLMMEERDANNEELARMNTLQEENFNGLIELLTSVIESKRQYHRGHSSKVAEIAGFIAKEMKLPRSKVREIRIAALLHEIGKLSIPDSLAMKNPVEYSESEKDFITSHPVDGSELLKKFSGFTEIAEIIRHFHEKVDGTGIPDRLKRPDIPIGSRIIAVANVYDNLVYRKKEMSVEEAFQSIEDMAGGSLDPKVIFELNKYAAKNPVTSGDRFKLVSLYELEPGMKLASAVFTASGAKLLPRNTVLDQETIEQVAQYHKREKLEETVFIK